MKVVHVSFILAMLANGANAKNTRILGKDASRLFGGRVWQERGSVEDKGSSKALREQGRRKEQEDIVSTDGNEVPHYEAESLDYFKKEMDPEFFEWVNPDEIVPGGVTCGFMKPSLGSRLGEVYPSIEVYVCARFATTQPASKGNIFVHCGGPISLSDCILSSQFNEENHDAFNIWGIDQRGMGRSKPTFIVDDCATSPPVRAENGTILEFPPLPEPTGFTMSDEDVESMKAALDVYKQRSFNCWKHPEFHMEAEQEDGTTKKYHFLEYSGTRQLAEDIERMRILMNAPYIHLWGGSYGTTVMATHATMFPSSVGLFTIDSCESPDLSHYYQAHSAAVNVDQRIDYAIFSCEAMNSVNPGSCPVTDLRKCVADAFALSTTPALGLSEIFTVLRTAPDRGQEFCDVAAEGDGDDLVALFNEVVPSTITAIERQATDPSSQPSITQGAVYGFPDYMRLIEEGGANPGLMIKHQDHSEPIYNPDRFIAEVVEFGERYTGSGTGIPVSEYMFVEYSLGYGVVKAVPLPQLGSGVKGIIAGALYDEATPYVWTQQMKDRFRNTKLITSQAPYHEAVTYGYPECGELVQHYYATGEMNFTDGYICGDRIPDPLQVQEHQATPEIVP